MGGVDRDKIRISSTATAAAGNAKIYQTICYSNVTA